MRHPDSTPQTSSFVPSHSVSETLQDLHLWLQLAQTAELFFATIHGQQEGQESQFYGLLAELNRFSTALEAEGIAVDESTKLEIDRLYTLWHPLGQKRSGKREAKIRRVAAWDETPPKKKKA